MDVLKRKNARCFEGPIGEVKRITERVVEIRLADGVELSRQEAEVVQRCIRELTGGAPAALLIDGRSSYALTFEAQQVVAADDRLIAVAYLAVRTVSRIIADYANGAHFKHVPVESFSERDRAVGWLQAAVQEAATPQPVDREGTTRMTSARESAARPGRAAR